MHSKSSTTIFWVASKSESCTEGGPSLEERGERRSGGGVIIMHSVLIAVGWPIPSLTILNLTLSNSDISNLNHFPLHQSRTIRYLEPPTP